MKVRSGFVSNSSSSSFIVRGILVGEKELVDRWDVKTFTDEDRENYKKSFATLKNMGFYTDEMIEEMVQEHKVDYEHLYIKANQAGLSIHKAWIDDKWVVGRLLGSPENGELFEEHEDWYEDDKTIEKIKASGLFTKTLKTYFWYSGH